jgi:hypothetical protein
LPSGVTTDIDPETAVAIGQPPRVVVEEEVAGEGEEGAVEEGAEPTGEAQATDTATEEG